LAKSIASLTSTSPSATVLPVSLAATSIRSARRAASVTAAARRTAARPAPPRAAQAGCAATAPATISSSTEASVTRACSIRSTPSTESAERRWISRPHARLSALAGSVSGSLSKPLPASRGRSACASSRRLCTRCGAGASTSTSPSEARNRPFSRSNMASFEASSKTADMKFSLEAFSSRRRIR
jgi:hypothetical protein